MHRIHKVARASRLRQINYDCRLPNDDLFEEDLLDDRDIDNDDLIDGLDLDWCGSKPKNKPEENIFGTSTTNSASGCLIFLLALPVAILLMMLI